MVKIFLCGPAKSGKSQLLEQLQKREKQCRKMKAIVGVTETVLQELGIRDRFDICEDKIVYDIQCKIADLQVKREKQFGESDILSDGCLINPVVYSLHYLNNRSLEDKFSERLAEYRNQLVILLSPIQTVEHRNTQMKLTAKGWDEMKENYLKIFDEYKIPFLDLGTLELSTRTELVGGCLKGKISNDILKLEMENVGCKNFPFYLEPHSRFEQICIPTLKIFQDHIEQDWTVEERGKSNRFIHRYGHGRLAMLAFDINIRASVVQKLLLGEVRISGEVYSFLGCSSNGLKNRKCFMWKGSAHEAESIIAENGNFSEIKTVSKRMARVGLLFSSVRITDVTIPDRQIIEEDDIEHSGKVFSDGCGAIGKDLAQQIYAKVKETELSEHYIPSVYQIRFQGYKGVLALDSTISNNCIKVRPSMKKFQTQSFPCICICDYSKPYTFGKLNKQFIQLLSGLGVPDSVFERKFDFYLKLIQSVFIDKEATIMLLQWKGMFDIAQKVLSIPSMEALNQSEIRKTVSEVQQSLVSSIEKLSILIPKSRTIFGVCDCTGALNYGQCFVRITESGVPKTLRGQIIVCKSPSYLLGDVRVLQAVETADINTVSKSLKDLVDCIVFPSKGARPHPDEIAGSDLDGDMYFVCWDETLIPPATRSPYDYPAAADKFIHTKISRESIVNYFSKQNETRKMVSRVDKYFNKWADSVGINSQECERLGRLFSRVIDASKTGEPVNIPLSLMEVKDTPSDEYVWVKLKRKALKFKQDFGEKFILANEREMKDYITESFVKEIIGQSVSNITEYKKFQFIMNFLRAKECESGNVIDTFLHGYADLINFTLFSVSEKRSAEDMGIPHATITNALNKSKILTEEEISCFQMHTSASPWNFYFRHGHDELDWIHLIKALTEQDRTFIVFKMPDQITVVLQFLQKQVLGTEQEVSPGTICSLFYSKHFGYRRKYILGPSYLLDFTRDTLQLYRQTKPKTFIWLRAQDWPKNVKKNERIVSEEIVNAVSVDLQRFDGRILEGNRKHPLITKTPLITMEVFVQNRNESDCYFDLVDINDMMPVEDANEEDADEGSQIINYVELFPRTTFDKIITSIDELVEFLKNAAESGNPYLFQSIFESWTQADLPSDIDLLVSKLLETIIQITSPMPLPEDICHVIEAIIVLTNKTIDNYSMLTKIARHLSQLHYDNIAQGLLDKISQPGPDIKPDEYIDLVSCWENWWFIDSKSATFILDKIYCDLKYLLHSKYSNDDKFHQLNYAVYFSRLQGLAMIQEIQSCKDHLRPDHPKRTKALSSTSESEISVIDSENSISFLKIDRSDNSDNNLVTFYRMSALEKRPNLCKGHYVALTRHVDYKASPTFKSYCCLGQIKELKIAPFTMTVEIIDIIPDVLKNCLHCKQTVFWRAEVIGNVTTFLRIMTTMKEILSADLHENQPVLACITHPGGFMKETALYENKEVDIKTDMASGPCLSLEELNRAQADAVNTAIKQEITLIQGPPGTGKTTCACSIVENIHKANKYDKLLVIAETNIAVDNITRKLRDKLLVLRVGTDEGVSSDLIDLTLTGQMQKLTESVNPKQTMFRDSQGIIRRNTQLINKLLKAADVVLTTCAGAGDPALESIKFEFVLVDEATQTTEPTLLCGLIHGAKHLVMIGDPKQLGPHVTVKDKKQSSELPCLTDLSTSVFHRFFETKVIPNICFLDTQHRMHKAIMQFPSQYFYDGNLKSGVVGSRTKVIFPWPNKNTPLCFVDVTGSHEQRIGTSFWNEQEIKAVELVIARLLNVEEEKRDQRLSIDDIGIITTYKAQVKRLQQYIKAKIEISSVDGFQGREKEVIVVSTVRANHNGILGFSDDQNRINVLMTRAKRGLIVVGNEQTLKTSDIWQKWLKQAPRLSLSELRTPVNTSGN